MKIELKMNPKIDIYLVEGCGRCPLTNTPECKVGKWQKELAILRRIVLECGLTEELKWGVPCYTFQKSNLILLHGFKEYCAILFVKGVLLSDTEGILIAQTENVQSARQIRFTDVQRIIELESILKAYIYEAVEAEKLGLKVNLKKTDDFILPQEFQDKLTEMSTLKMAFEALTPGRQRAYILHFSQPKQSKTRAARVEKYIPHILNGKGLHD